MALLICRTSLIRHERRMLTHMSQSFLLESSVKSINLNLKLVHLKVDFLPKVGSDLVKKFLLRPEFFPVFVTSGVFDLASAYRNYQYCRFAEFSDWKIWYQVLQSHSVNLNEVFNFKRVHQKFVVTILWDKNT